LGTAGDAFIATGVRREEVLQLDNVAPTAGRERAKAKERTKRRTKRRTKGRNIMLGRKGGPEKDKDESDVSIFQQRKSHGVVE